MHLDLEKLGYVAGILTTGAFLPQVIRSWRTRETKDLSPWLLALLVPGAILWLIWGIGVGEKPAIAANGITLLLLLSLVVLKIRYR